MVTPAAPANPEEAGPALPDPYEITSIRSVPAPAGTTGAGWYRYEISQGTNRIVGYRDGGINDVRLQVEAIVLQLNERRRHRRGRVHVVLQSPSTTTKPAAER